MEQRLLRLEQQMQQLNARAALGDLMGRYALYWGAGCGERIAEELWDKGDEISLEYGASGVYCTAWKVRSFYYKDALPGTLATLSFSSPLLQIDPDGQHARGIWTAFATETDPGDFGPAPVTDESNRRVLFSSSFEGKQYRAEVLLQKYDVRFVLRADGWKIAHLHVIEYFRCPYDRDWVRYARERFATDGMWLESLFETCLPFPEDAHGENLPTTCTTDHWQYAPDRTTRLLPELP
jgi:hypothetical protein